MLNQIVLVGRIERIKDRELILSVPRSYKNDKGEYDTDYITIQLNTTLKNNINDYLNLGDMVGIKGHVEQLEREQLTIQADRLTYLSSHKQKNDNDIMNKGEI